MFFGFSSIPLGGCVGCAFDIFVWLWTNETNEAHLWQNVNGTSMQHAQAISWLVACSSAIGWKARYEGTTALHRRLISFVIGPGAGFWNSSNTTDETTKIKKTKYWQLLTATANRSKGTEGINGHGMAKISAWQCQWVSLASTKLLFHLWLRVKLQSPHVPPLAKWQSEHFWLQTFHSNDSDTCIPRSRNCGEHSSLAMFVLLTNSTIDSEWFAKEQKIKRVSHIRKNRSTKHDGHKWWERHFYVFCGNYEDFRHKRLGSTTGTLSSSTCKSWWQFPRSAHGQSPANSRNFCAFVSRTCKLKDLTAIWCACPNECRTIWECFEFQLMSKKKTLTLSHKLCSAFRGSVRSLYVGLFGQVLQQMFCELMSQLMCLWSMGWYIHHTS